MKTIVVGYDGTVPAERALGRAAEIAKAFDAQLIVVEVQPLIEPSVDVPIGAFGLAPFPYTTTTQEDEDRWREHRDHVSSFLSERGVRHEFEGVLGRPGEEIVEIADERDADMIVVGTHEPGFLERLVAGSVSELVARRAHCDVLIVHGREGRSGKKS
jgi:nucleotide-binding universal stress UspA family protein